MEIKEMAAQLNQLLDDLKVVVNQLADLLSIADGQTAGYDLGQPVVDVEPEPSTGAAELAAEPETIETAETEHNERNVAAAESTAETETATNPEKVQAQTEKPQAETGKTTSQTAKKPAFGMPNLANLPGLGNLFGGLMGGGMPNLAGLTGASAPKTLEEVKHNPQMMSMLSSLESNPAMLQTIAAMSGLDKEQILKAIQTVKADQPLAETAGTTATTAAPNLNLGGLGNLFGGGLGGLSSLFGGGQMPQAAPPAPGLAAPSAPTPAYQTFDAGSMTPAGYGIPQQLAATAPHPPGDPLNQLLQQWRWQPRH